MNNNRSVATIDAPEFINLQENAINPGISECEVKVFYLGKNRNGSYIDKNTAIQMANSLPGTPIVGAYRKDIDDFGDHGHVIHIENGEVQFSCNTIPYGFVAPDARCWFKKFKDTDEFGESVVREYLMTTGYLWTGQYPEIEMCINGGKGQSMELDPETMDGHWATDNNSGIEFFIINDAIFSKLCVLGDDVEPCFEGAAVQSPQISKEFTNNKDFANTLFKMMQELSFALQNNEGGSDMSNLEQETVEEENETTVEEEEATDADVSADNDVADNDDSSDVSDSADSDDDSDGDFACGGDKKKKYSEDDKKKDEEDNNNDDDDDDNDEKKKPSEHSLTYTQLEVELQCLQEQVKALRQFKLETENAEKNKLFSKYFMLDEESKAELQKHMEEYTYQQIEEKLALMYVKQNVNFDSIDGSFENQEEESEEDPALTFSLNDDVAGYVPPIVEALRQTVTK